ncbi:hypothetical protein [Adhaeribacter rhizoryzae]|uniref:Uncharacterized protein n=1 Tax=Adhaeribacter rhizoryzae TaxID=2607907 RepID=A0A5M6DNQ3_9BACT|nr:hypothetical protein [Adhaeribacter rhizoryzae]KAA5549114.1 hypothetical protein F0145_00500 [Adhaeribacter rhizoryzae]
MEVSKLTLGHTFYGDTGELSGLVHDYLLTKNDTCFFVVELKIYGKNKVREFSSLQTALKYSRYHNVVYRFIEYTDLDERRRILVIHNVYFSNKNIGYQNFYGIGGDWKLFVNDMDDIVVQHIQFPKTNITVRFREFPRGSEFYLHLGCLIYVLTNYKLDTEKEIKSTFQQIIDCVLK